MGCGCGAVEEERSDCWSRFSYDRSRGESRGAAKREHELVSDDDEVLRALEEAVDEACVPALDEATAPHLPAIREALRDVDTTHRPSPEEIIERMRTNGLEDPEGPG